MGILYFALIIGAVYFVIERKIKLREKYQIFSARFTGYYIDFISLLLIVSCSFGLIVILSYLNVPDFITKNLFWILLVYSLYIVIPCYSKK